MQQFELFPQTGQPGRRLIRREKLLRLRFERHHRRGKVAATRQLDQSCQHGPVAEVDTIEVTDGQGRRLIGLERCSPQYAHIPEIVGKNQKG